MHRNWILDIDDARPGMILSDSVLDGQGGILVVSGAELTDGLLRSLQRRGIEKLLIVNDQIPEEEIAFEKIKQQQRLTKLFRKYAGTDTNNLLFQCVTTYRLG